MRSKLHAIAQTFVREVGDDLQHYTFVFPNHRAGLFFRKYLSQYIERPLFAPHVMSINECFSELSDLQVADQLTLLLRIYDSYRQLRLDTEPLERFIYWGKMMLSDFSEIDNHLVPHVEALFASIKDLHAIDEHYSYLTDNQRKALARFWQDFQTSNTQHPNTELHNRFLHTWDVLYPLYTALRANLSRDGLAYEGMLHREVLEHWDTIPKERFRKQYVFLGFNALTASERELMLRLQAMEKADFYFDYDNPYLRDPHNKASLFMEDNLRLFTSRFAIPDSRLATPSNDIGDITLISVPSTIGEVHEVHRILSNITQADCQDLTRTAVVLPDEQLLIPLLNAFPKSVGKINVTMGYPLRATSLYMLVAYPEQYLIPMPETAEAFLMQMREYLLLQRNDDNMEGIYQLTKVLDRLQTALVAYSQIAFTVADVQQLLKMLTLDTTIPYVGEPLDGLQVMGVLETRALDFDNVIITGFNDDLYPGRTSNNSFVPYTLRCGFGLPTPDRQNAIFAYNFYRMLSYAKHVWCITNSTADEQHSGEVSRYFYQLKWQYGVDIKQVVAVNQLVMPNNKDCAPIIKDERVAHLSHLSASALGTYLRCPKLFYYRHIERIQEPEMDESVSVSEATLGNVLHDIMHALYTPYVGQMITNSTIEKLLRQVNEDAYWASLAPVQDLNGDRLAEKVVHSYVNNILNYDYTRTPFQFLAAEQPIRVVLPNNMTINGTLDRLDMKADMVRVVDYKTGKADLAYTSMADVFGVVPLTEGETYALRKKGNAYILQTMLYCWILSDQYAQILPSIYPARRLSDVSVNTCVHTSNDGAPLLFDEGVKEEFVTELNSLIDEIRNIEIPFYPTTDSHTCEYCPYVQLCGKKG